jgi:two-component system sensor histidine kinase/response regulator
MKVKVTPQKGIILLVDDNPTNLGVLFDSLSDAGFKTLVAQDGERAIAQTTHVKPDIILLDVMMPGIDGFETCRRLKENADTKDIPVIFMTALTETVDKVRGFGLGAVDYVTKPVQPEEVLARVTTHLAIQNLQKQLAQQNQRLQREISDRQRAEEALWVLLRAVSHDLRNPVTGMLMVLKNLLKSHAPATPNPRADRSDSTDDPSATIPVPRAILERMAYSSDRQLSLINSLLEARTIETQGIALQCQPLQLNSLILSLLQDFEPLLTKNQATLTNRVSPDLPLISADSTQLWRVFENLIINALKHNPPCVHLVIEAVVEAPMIRCSVQDNGIGISAEECAQLFELYKRGDNTRHTNGLGLGLYLCRQIITAHGGEIGIISRPAVGSTFWFTLPLLADETSNSASKSSHLLNFPAVGNDTENYKEKIN